MRANPMMYRKLIQYIIGFDKSVTDLSVINKADVTTSDVDLLVTIKTLVIAVFVSLAQSHNRKRHRNEVYYVISSEKKSVCQLI